MQAEAITHRRVLAIAIPIVLSNATVPILGLVDTGVVGQLGRAEPIAAVGIGALFLAAFYWVFGFLRMGVTGLTAQAVGQGDHPETCALLMRGLLIAGAAGLGIIALQVPLFGLGFRVSPAGAEVESLARDYMSIRVWSAPAAIALYAVNGWLIAQERTRAVLILQLWMNGLNIVLDLVFVLQLGWGVTGVASATLIAEWTGLALGLWLCRAGFAGAAWRAWSRVFDRARLRHMASVNGDILVRSLILQGIFISFLLLSARFGDVQLAATHVLLQFLEVTAFALDGFAFAAEALVGQAVGAGRVATLRRAVVVSGIWGGVLCVLLAALFALAGGASVDMMTTAVSVRDAAREMLPWMVVAPIFGMAAWMLDGVFIGATRTRDMRNMMAVSLAIYIVAVVVLMPVFGAHGMWAALMISFVARGVTLGLRYPALEKETASEYA